MIYFMTIIFDKTVHVIGGGGFTNILHSYTEAASPEDAEDITTRHWVGRGLKVRSVNARRAYQQDKTRYTFPGNILQAAAVHNPEDAPCA